MNNPIQVEHTVTEQVTGLGLIALQLAVASDAPMPIPSDHFDSTRAATPRHAIEARITAEDAWAGHVLAARLRRARRPRHGLRRECDIRRSA